MNKHRWKAVAYYRTQNGTVDVDYYLEELSELDEKIEAGPHWDTIEKIEVFRINHVEAVDLTIERAKTL